MIRTKIMTVFLLAAMAIQGAAFAEKPSGSVAKGCALQPGDCIGILSPGFSEDTKKLEKAVRELKKMGFRLKFGNSYGGAHGYFAGTDSTRASDINRFFEDEEVKAILCTRGGYGSARLLDKLNYDAIARHPKQLIGYSDVTALHIALGERSHVATVHGPMLVSFRKGFRKTDYNASHFIKGLKGELYPGDIPMPEGKRLETVIPGTAEGAIIGGNLTVITSLLGTPYEMKGDGALLLIEDVDESTYRVDRMLNQLWQNGLLQRVNGILIGDFTGADDDWEEGDFRLDEVLLHYARLSGKPVLKGVPAGHKDNNLYIPLGVRAVMRANPDGTASLRIMEDPVLHPGK